jgi:hypothetical protein
VFQFFPVVELRCPDLLSVEALGFEARFHGVSSSHALGSALPSSPRSAPSPASVFLLSHNSYRHRFRFSSARARVPRRRALTVSTSRSVFPRFFTGISTTFPRRAAQALDPPSATFLFVCWSESELCPLLSTRLQSFSFDSNDSRAEIKPVLWLRLGAHCGINLVSSFGQPASVPSVDASSECGLDACR